MTALTEFGSPIPVDRKRPEWLALDDECIPHWEDGHPRGDENGVCEWSDVTHIRLRADHPYYARTR